VQRFEKPRQGGQVYTCAVGRSPGLTHAPRRLFVHGKVRESSLTSSSRLCHSKSGISCTRIQKETAARLKFELTRKVGGSGRLNLLIRPGGIRTGGQSTGTVSMLDISCCLVVKSRKQCRAPVDLRLDSKWVFSIIPPRHVSAVFRVPTPCLRSICRLSACSLGTPHTNVVDYVM
jgi:hypothetical protein